MKEKIIIVSLNGDDCSGGVERVVYYLKNILSEKYDVSVMKRNGKPGKLDKIIFPLLFSFRLLFKNKSLIISNSLQSFLYPADFSIHHGTSGGYMLHAGIKSKKTAFLAWMEKISAKRAKTVIAVSENCRRELVELYGIPPVKIYVLNNFVDERLFYPQETEKNNKIKILFSGRLENRKGLSDLISLANSIELNDNCQLMIAVNSKENCESFVNYKNTVISAHLDIKSMREFYNSGDVFYFPTKYEGFSMSTLEALACGIPVVGTGFAIPEEIRSYDFVHLTEDGNAENIVKIIEKMKNDFYNKHSEIHGIIAKDFGTEQYKLKLYNLIDRGNNICRQ